MTSYRFKFFYNELRFHDCAFAYTWPIDGRAQAIVQRDNLLIKLIFTLKTFLRANATKHLMKYFPRNLGHLVSTQKEKERERAQGARTTRSPFLFIHPSHPFVHRVSFQEYEKFFQWRSITVKTTRSMSRPGSSRLKIVHFI